MVLLFVLLFDTYGVNLKRSYFLWVQQESYSRLDKWKLHWDRIVVQLATEDDSQLHRLCCVRIDHQQAPHLRATELGVVVDLWMIQIKKKKNEKSLTHLKNGTSDRNFSVSTRKHK